MLATICRSSLILLSSLMILLACKGGGRPDITTTAEAQATSSDIDLNTESQTAVGSLLLLGLPDGRTEDTNFDVTVTSTTFVKYIYKFGPAEQLRCAENGGYSIPRSITEIIAIQTANYNDGFMKLCILGLTADGTRQNLSQALQAFWVKETEPMAQEEIKESTISDASQILPPPNVLSNNPFVINCNQEQVTKAVNSLIPRDVIIANQARNDGSDQVYRIYWLNYDGNRVLYADLNPGFQILIRGFETHPWLIADIAGNCKGIYVTIQNDIFMIDLK